MRRIILSFVLLFCLTLFTLAQDHPTTEQPTTETHEQTATEPAGKHHEPECGEEPDPFPIQLAPTAFHHISDQNIYSIGPFSIPLPCMLYSKEDGWKFFSSGKLGIGHHGMGHKAFDRYVLVEGKVRRITDTSFPTGEVEIGEHNIILKKIAVDGKNKEVAFVCYKGQQYPTDAKSTADGGLFGGGITSFYDFSLTKNVTTMMIVFAFLAWMFFSVAKAYRTREGMAPKGIQSFIEPIFLFIQEEVAKPFLGHKWQQYLPFLLSLFFFILGLNLFGQVPFFGNANVTGNLAVTLVLAVITFILVTIKGNRNYWSHVLWMPGVPAVIKVLILTPVEILGLFIKPVTLMLRLFANITAGHMVMVIFVGLIFFFGKGEALPTGGAAIGSALLTLFMMAIELLVAFIQAFVFTILTASYIGAATEEAHH